MDTIGVAVIGAGGIGTLRAHSCSQIPQIGHLAVCDIDAGKLGKLAEAVNADQVTENYEEAIRDDRVQAVIVSTDEESHYGPAKLAASLGKPVLIEKPFVLNLDEADDIIATVGIPYESVLFAILAAALAGVLAALLPARRAAKLNVLDAIATGG